MPARISMTTKQRDVLLALPETENEIVRHYTKTRSFATIRWTLKISPL